MQIHLAKPGGERHGPFTLEQVNQDLAAKKYRDSDFWAWYDGADAWVPLYSVPGILASALSPRSTTASTGGEEPSMAAEFKAHSASGNISAATASAVTTDKPEQEPAESATAQLASGMPFGALQQIFIFTTGEGPDLMKSPVTHTVLQRIVGEDWAAIREKVPRDVFGRCDIGEKLRQEGKVPDAAWRAMSALKPALIQQAKSGALRTCVRTFSIESGEVVAVFLFYAKQ